MGTMKECGKVTVKKTKAPIKSLNLRIFEAIVGKAILPWLRGRTTVERLRMNSCFMIFVRGEVV
jgi:hypothetical protein